MLRELRIRNLAIIEDLSLEFDEGLNILTGETGAGKSIILAALRLALGERASSDDVRTGAESAEAEALLDGPLPPSAIALLEEAGLPIDEEGLVLRREVAANGKSRAVINGKLASLAQLRQLGETLVALHGQHQHQTLLDPATHLEALDDFADVATDLGRMAEAHQAWAEARSALEKLQGDERTLAREKDMLEQYAQEIEKAALISGEDEKLAIERERLRNAEQLRENSSRAHAIMQEGEADTPAVLTLLGQVAAEIHDIAKRDVSQNELSEAAADLRFRAEDLAARLMDYGMELEGDPRRLQQVDDRLETIRNLKRKHGATLDEVIAAGKEYRARVNSLSNRDEELKRLAEQVAKTEKRVVEVAEALSEKRQKAARRLEKAIVAELGELHMKRSAFRADFVREPAAVTGAAGGHAGNGADFGGGARYLVGASGVDRVEFLLSTNQGEALKPLRKIASGGELSRIMLAIKSLLAQRDGAPTLIFDEVDAGISGAAGQVVGDKLRRLGETFQVICITHLPQIAARGSSHFAVEKVERGKRVVTQVRRLKETERVEEIARLLGGDGESASGKKHAAELLSKAG